MLSYGLLHMVIPVLAILEALPYISFLCKHWRLLRRPTKSGGSLGGMVCERETERERKRESLRTLYCWHDLMMMMMMMIYLKNIVLLAERIRLYKRSTLQISDDRVECMKLTELLSVCRGNPILICFYQWF